MRICFVSYNLHSLFTYGIESFVALWYNKNMHRDIQVGQEKSGKRISKITLGMLIALAVVFAIMIVLLILRTNSQICEWICRNAVNLYINVVGRIISVVNFNVFEVLATFAVIYVLASIVVSIILFKKKKVAYANRIMIALLIVAVCIGNLYIFTAGFAYNRQDAPIEVYDGQIDSNSAEKAYIALVNDFNLLCEQLPKDESGRVVSPYTQQELREKIRQAYQELITDDYYYDYTPKAKPIISSLIMAHNGIAGISFLPTAEGGYNKDMPMTDIANTIAHEYAHIRGVMKENEANALSAYVLLNSNDPYLKYCFYVGNYGDILEFVMYNKDYNDIISQYPIDASMRLEQLYSYNWWQDKNLFRKIGNFFNNLYLKINGQEDGVGSYIENPDIEDSGEVDEDGNTIYVIVEYTTIQKIIYDYYDTNMAG